jgi:hypothetical protein
MMEQPTSRIPEELLQQQHQAAEHFHECRKHLEAAMDDADYGHQERVDAAEEQLRQAEREVEGIEEQIKRVMATER